MLWSATKKLNYCIHLLVVGDTSNFHFNMIPSSMGISIDDITYDVPAYVNVKFHMNSVKNVEAIRNFFCEMSMSDYNRGVVISISISIILGHYSISEISDVVSKY